MIKPRIRISKLLAFFFCLALVTAAGCDSSQPSGVNLAGGAISTVGPTILPPRTPATLTACSPNPDGLSLQVKVGAQAQGFQTVQVDGKGFTPQEKVQIVITGQGATHTSRVETTDFGVGSDGSFSSVDAVQLDEPKMTWQVYVVHQRGTACASFTTE